MCRKTAAEILTCHTRAVNITLGVPEGPVGEERTGAPRGRADIIVNYISCEGISLFIIIRK